MGANDQTIDGESIGDLSHTVGTVSGKANVTECLDSSFEEGVLSENENKNEHTPINNRNKNKTQDGLPSQDTLIKQPMPGDCSQIFEKAPLNGQGKRNREMTDVSKEASKTKKNKKDKKNRQ